MKLQRSFLGVSFLLLAFAVPLLAQNSYQRTTIQASAAPYCTPWIDSGSKAGVTWSASTTTGYLEIFPDTKYQPILGWGGTFQDMGWEAMGHLSAAGKDSVLRALFDTSGCNINWGRIPVGCCDYDRAMVPYSCDDNAGDYSMAQFSMHRDSVRRIPFIKAAQAFHPDFRFWASPWSPPGWMKTTNSYSGGHIKTDSATFAAYALYLSKWIQGYKAAGINVESISPQNEPDQVAGSYPQCGWTQPEEQTFYKNYMIPRFKKDSLTARIMLGLYCCNSVSGWLTPFLQDSVISNFVNMTNHSYESTNQGPACVAAKKVPFIEAESAWSPGDETWSTANGIFTNIQNFMVESTYVYTIWNCVGNSTGRGAFAGSSLGAQPLMITIDTNSGKVVYSPYYYAFKHHSHDVKVGAHLVKSTGTGISTGLKYSTYLNPNGDVILVASSTGNTSFIVKIGTKAFTVAMPANSFNTVRFTGATAVLPSEQIVTKSNTSALNSVRLHNSTLYFSLGSGVKAKEADLSITNLQGRTIWTSHRAGSEMQGQQAIAIRSEKGNMLSGTYLLSVKIKSDAGAITKSEQKVMAVN